MSESRIAQKAPIAVRLEAGERRFWCARGRSSNQPFCDGSHRGTGISPLEYVTETGGKVFFCCCKRTRSPPVCDGSHKQLRD